MKLFFSKYNQLIIYTFLALLIGFNVYLYKTEFTVTSDPNDNIFHYALIDEAKNILKDVFTGKLSPMYLLDSWNERWAAGFALSNYYSHLPQAVIALLSFIVPVSTFSLFVIIRTLVLILLPLTFFISARILGFSNWFALILAFFSQVIFTDGLYGTDTSSFLWRGWGLSAELWAIVLLPLAFAYTVNYLKEGKNLFKSVLFNFLLGQAHIGILLLVLISYPVYLIIHINDWFKVGKRLLMVVILTLATLLYFILPFFILGLYRNFSYWDPIWKFNSFGMNHIVTLFANGDLFDFNRLPVLTFLVIAGILIGIKYINKLIGYFSILFGVYFVLFFGRTTLGKLIDLVPGFSEYHLHRLVVMVQFIGLFIAAWSTFELFKLIINKTFAIKNKLRWLKSIIYSGLIAVVILSIYYLEKPLVKYVFDNNEMIKNSNIVFQKENKDFLKIVNKLKSLPRARVYGGRPGNWGKGFTIANTQVYMALSRDGLSTIGFLPQSWSPNSDPEQFFNENDLSFYKLYNVGYIVAPDEFKAPDFARKILNSGKFNLYSVPIEGWFTSGTTSMVIKSDKTHLLNFIHAWIASPLFKNNEFPIIRLSGQSDLKNSIKMIDLNNFQDNLGKTKNIWKNFPLASSGEKQSIVNKLKEEYQNGRYRAQVEVKTDCLECVLVLKQTYHPNWQVLVNGKPVKAVPLFPFYIGIPINKGNYEIVATYKPSALKTGLVIGQIILLIPILIYFNRFKSKKLI